MLSIANLGMISSVGYSPQATAAALRAGISRIAELAYRDRTGSEIVGAKVPGIPTTKRGIARLRALAAQLWRTLPVAMRSAIPWSQMPVFLCLPEPQRPGPRLGESDLRACIAEAGVSQPLRVFLVESGPTGAFAAIAHAREVLTDSRTPGCMIVAIDSLVDARVLAWLDSHARLKTTLQTDGVIPGEAACLAVVGRHPFLNTAIALRGIGQAHEEASVLNDKPLLGHGMARAMRSALSEAGLEMHNVDLRISDAAGESYAFEELVLAQTRLMKQTRPTQPLWHPVDSVGDCGAAAGLIQFAWAEQALARRYAPGSTIALHGSSTFGARAAAIVAPLANPEGR